MTAEDGPTGEARSHAAFVALAAVAARVTAMGRLAPFPGEPALRAIAGAAAAALRTAAASIALHDPVADALVFRAAAGPEGEGVVGLTIASHEGIAGYVYQTGQPLAVADVVADPRFDRGAAERTGYVPRALLAVPLVDDEEIIGVMEWLDPLDGRSFDLVDMDVAARVAAAATSIARATRPERDAGQLVGRVLSALSAAQADGALAPTAAEVDSLVGVITGELAGHEPLWRLADRIGQLRAADPDDLELAIAWLDALLARASRRRRPGRRPTG